ncbi:condensation domain-containing protein, partial [Streptomyces sp. NPDC056462]|uniref:condensation domain-containing protein n=1 Tax=Streptomyces sp. NPDC056462 TaxID=3345826 RepID=UPI0036BF65C0
TGHLRYLGRTDDQIKIRGQRVELGEIQTHIANLPHITQAAVLIHNDRLTAYYVTEPSTEDEADAGPDFTTLHTHLPDHMVPTTYIKLDTLPLTPNGKLDRKALPTPDPTPTTTTRPPRTPHEQLLCTLFAETLGTSTPIGIDDNFFTLGGHSLLGVTLVQRLRERGVSIDVRALFSHPTVASLAAAAGRTEVAVPPNLIPSDAVAITPDMLPLVDLSTEEVEAIVAQVSGGVSNIADVYPLAPLQEGIHFHHLMTARGGDDVYVLPVVLRFDSRDRFDRFHSALQKVVDRHDILRTAVLWEGLGEPVQVVLRHAEIPVTTVRPEQGRSDLVDRILTACPSVMDLRAAPLMHLHVTEPDEGQPLHAVLQFHHLILDHTALSVVLEEVRAVLDAREHELPTPLPFRDVVAQARLGVPQEEHQAYFSSLLGDVTEPTAPFGVLEIHGDGSGTAEASLSLDSELSNRLREQARRHGASPATLFHVIWSRMTAATSGRDDVVFGTVLFGRMHAGAGSDRVPGLFINTLPVRARGSSVTVGEAVSGMRDQLADLIVHEHAPLSLAQQLSGVPARTPLFTSLLNYRHSQDFDEASTTGTVMEGIELVHAHERTNYPVTVSVDDTGDAFTITAQTAAPIDPQAMCEQVSVTAERVVSALETAPDTLLHRVDVLQESERHRVLVEWNDTAVEVAGPGTLHERFEEQAAATPDACALRFNEQQLTYGELNARANQVAHGLIARGVGPESVVAVA